MHNVINYTCAFTAMTCQKCIGSQWDMIENYCINVVDTKKPLICFHVTLGSGYFLFIALFNCLLPCVVPYSYWRPRDHGHVSTLRCSKLQYSTCMHTWERPHIEERDMKSNHIRGNLQLPRRRPLRRMHPFSFIHLASLTFAWVTIQMDMMNI